MFKIPLGVKHRFSDKAIETHGCSAVVKDGSVSEKGKKTTITGKDDTRPEARLLPCNHSLPR